MVHKGGLLQPTFGGLQTVFHDSPGCPSLIALKHYAPGFQLPARSCHALLLRMTLDFVVLTRPTGREFLKFEKGCLRERFW